MLEVDKLYSKQSSAWSKSRSDMEKDSMFLQVSSYTIYLIVRYMRLESAEGRGALFETGNNSGCRIFNVPL